MPASLKNWESWLPALESFVLAILPLLLAILIGLILASFLLRIMRHVDKSWRHKLGEHLLPHITRALRWAMLLLAFNIGINFSGITPEWKEHLGVLAHPALIGVIGWLAIGMILGVSDWLGARFSWENIPDNLTYRRLSTQLRVFRNIAVFFVIVVTGIVIALSIPSLRNLGVSLFASAGVAGIVVGMAARPALSNVIAGVQLALTQPIRIDDVVIVEGEWGRIQEINGSYVVVAIWDQRRMVVPLSYFIEKPFQNWTHTSSQLMGTVYLYLDYTAPLDAIRTELDRLLQDAAQWDKRVGIVQVTDSKENTMEVRILLSSSNASGLFDLRCDIREGMIDFLKKTHPECLPRFRGEIVQPAA